MDTPTSSIRDATELLIMPTGPQDALPLGVKPGAFLRMQIEMQHLDSTSGCGLSAGFLLLLLCS